jgi:DNA-binding CsgD family transcriptional regulator
MLHGRRTEVSLLDELLREARRARSSTLVLSGEAGSGKSALLEYARRQAEDMHVLPAHGLGVETSLPFAALDRLVRPLWGYLPGIPAPQASALRGALGEAGGGGDDRFLIALGTLSLLTALAFGGFLRRTRRRVESREHLRAAGHTFEVLGARVWAERARRELRASGESARRAAPGTSERLTPQELQVAQFVSRGLSNHEVAGQLFLSPRTVAFHLRNVFRKLDITSRTELGHLELDAE